MFRYKHRQNKNVFDNFKLKTYSVWVSVIMYFDKQHHTRRYQFECECFNKEHARYLILKNFKKEITSETVKYIKTVKDRKFNTRFMEIDSIEEFPMAKEVNLDDTDINKNIRLIRKDSLPLRRITFWS
jgi:hypothetical protein